MSETEKYWNPSTGANEILRTCNVYKAVSLNATGNVWTPATGKKFRILMISYQIPEDCTITSGAELTTKLQDGSGNDIGINFIDWVPGTVPGSAIGDNHTVLYLPNNGYLSTTANNVLVANLSATLSGGHIGIVVGGCEE